MTFNDLAKATELTVNKNGDIRFITENGLTVFEHFHKVGITCSPSVDSETVSMITELTPQLFDMIVTAYKVSREEHKMKLENERIEHLKETFHILQEVAA